MDDVISGAYVFTGERSAAGYRINKMAKTLYDAANRARFQEDEAGYMLALGCSDDEIDMVQRRDWKALMQAGASIYLLLRVGAATGHTIQEVGRATGEMAGGH